MERRQAWDPRGGGYPRLSFLPARPPLFPSGRPFSSSIGVMNPSAFSRRPWVPLPGDRCQGSSCEGLFRGQPASRRSRVQQPHSTSPPCYLLPGRPPTLSLLSWLPALLTGPGHEPGAHRAHCHYKHRTPASQIPGCKCSPVFCEYFSLNRTQDIDAGKPLG